MKKPAVLFLVLPVLLMFSAAALGVPTWRTSPAGQPPTTYQQWTFDSNDSIDVVPEVSANTYGTATADIEVSGDVSGIAGWKDTWLGRDGVWHGDLTKIWLTIPNRDVPDDYKEIWIEVGFRGFLIDSAILDPTTGITALGSTVDELQDGWKTLTIGWRIEPNPVEETVYLAFEDSGADLDYVIVDTICIPEPATLLLLLTGVAAYRHKARRQTLS